MGVSASRFARVDGARPETLSLEMLGKPAEHVRVVVVCAPPQPPPDAAREGGGAANVFVFELQLPGSGKATCNITRDGEKRGC